MKTSFFRRIALWLLLSIPSVAFAQNFKSEMDFIHYLNRNDQVDDAIFQLQRVGSTYDLTKGQADSLNYHLGWGYYNLKSLDNAIHHLSEVSPTSAYYYKSRFFTGYNLAYTGQLEEGEKMFREEIQQLDSLSHGRELQAFELGGIALINRDYESFLKHKEEWSFSYYALAKQEQSMMHAYDRLITRKKRSPLLAGTMSAIIPGTGKMYAGKAKEGLISFFQVSALGLATWEQYRANGLASPGFIIFGGIFSVFYLGNVWGSTLSVKVIQDEFDREINNRILLDMHIPLRTIFN